MAREPDRVPRAPSRRTVAARGLSLLLVGAACAGCGPQLAHVGYAAPNKIWYHWVDGADHSIVVCDVLPDGSETNCRETEI